MNTPGYANEREISKRKKEGTMILFFSQDSDARGRERVTGELWWWRDVI